MVISIISVLSAILMMNFVGVRERAKDSQKIQDLNNLKTALRMYYNDIQSYPTGSACGTCLTSAIGTSGYAPGIAGVGYTYTSNGVGFTLTVGLESGSGDDDINSQKKCGVASPVDKIYMLCEN